MNSPRYQKITIACTPDLVDVLSNFLTERSPNGVVMQDNFRDGKSAITAYIDRHSFQELSPDEIRSYCDSIVGNFENPSFHLIESVLVEDEDWLAEWKKSFLPIRIAERIVITPSWILSEPRDDDIVIIIDPKNAFGTGHHQTTADCIKALVKIGCQGKTVLDYGCGTGILAIVASKLGARQVYAIDNDPDAINCAQENFAVNNVDVCSVLSDNFVAAETCDIVVANLTFDQIVRSFALLDRSLSDDGRLILSGILASEQGQISDICQRWSFVITDKFAGPEWLTIICQRRGRIRC